MKGLIVFLLLLSVQVHGQSDTLRPIEERLVPSSVWNGNHWRGQVKAVYNYDGIEVSRPVDLGKYIMASGDANAVAEFQKFKTGRVAGTWLGVGGILLAVIGTPMMLSNRPNKDGRFLTTQPYQCPPGFLCSGGPLTVPDTERQSRYSTGAILLVSGGLLSGLGWTIRTPGFHFRRAIQYYNKSLNQQTSLHLAPFWYSRNAGVGLIATF